MLLPAIWKLEAALPRTAVNAQLRMRLPRTVTLAARNTLTALPYWPEPPERFSIASMRLSVTMVPSSPGLPRQIWMPLLPAPAIVLRAISSARASNEWIATSALSVMSVSTISPSIAVQAMAVPPAARISQSTILMRRTFSMWRRPRRSGRRRRWPSSTRPESVTCSAPAALISEALSLRMSLVAPRTPTICALAGSLRLPTR